MTDDIRFQIQSCVGQQFQLLLLRPEEVAVILGTTTGTLKVWRCLGKGPTYIKAGRLVRYRPSDVEKFITMRGGCVYHPATRITDRRLITFPN